MVYMPYDNYKKWKEANATEDKFEVEFFKTDNGNKPAKEFLDSLDKKMRSKMLWLLSILEENGNELREPYSKYIGDHIFELRAKVGTDITRMLYFFYHNGRIIVTNGFVKKTQNTPPQDKALAKKYRGIFLVRETEKEGKNE
mgnify:FL=1|jgi:phage-related protein